MASTSTSAPFEAAPAVDVEQGKPPSPTAEDEGGDFFDYYVVYGFSLFIVIVSSWAFFFPFSDNHLIGTVLGTGGLVAGAFLILNTDLLVTSVRLWRDLRVFRENNEKFKASLVQQKKQVRDLKKTQKAVATLETMAQGRMDKVQSEMDKMTVTARDEVTQNISDILLITRPRKRNLEAGEDLQKTLRSFDNTYVQGVPQITARFEEMKKGIDASPHWKRVGSLSNDSLGLILAGVFFEEIKDIEEWVRSHLEAEGEAEGEAAAVPEKDSWAEAVAFAGVEEKPVRQVAKEDSWADAIAFAGPDR